MTLYFIVFLDPSQNLDTKHLSVQFIQPHFLLILTQDTLHFVMYIDSYIWCVFWQISVVPFDSHVTLSLNNTAPLQVHVYMTSSRAAVRPPVHDPCTGGIFACNIYIYVIVMSDICSI